MGTYISPADLDEALPTVSPTRVDEVITDVEAMALLFAPGLAAAAFLASPTKMATARAILRAAVIYQCAALNDGDHPRSPTVLAPSQIEALRSLTSTAVVTPGVYTLPLSRW